MCCCGQEVLCRAQFLCAVLHWSGGIHALCRVLVEYHVLMYYMPLGGVGNHAVRSVGGVWGRGSDRVLPRCDLAVNPEQFARY